MLENLITLAATATAGSKVDRAVAAYVKAITSATEKTETARLTAAPVWAALALTRGDDAPGLSLTAIGEMFGEPKSTVDRYSRVGYVLLAVPDLTPEHRAKVAEIVGIATADRGRVSTSIVRECADAATDGDSAVRLLTAASRKAKAAAKAKAKAKAEAESESEGEGEGASHGETPQDWTVAALLGALTSAANVADTLAEQFTPDERETLAVILDRLAVHVVADEEERAA